MKFAFKMALPQEGGVWPMTTNACGPISQEVGKELLKKLKMK